MPSHDAPPWNSSGYPGPKPAVAPFGCIVGRWAAGGSAEEAARAVACDRADLVWTPESPSLEPPEAFRSMRETARRRLWHRGFETIRWAGLGLVLWVAMGWTQWDMLIVERDILVFNVVALGLVPIVAGVRCLFAAGAVSDRAWDRLAEDGRFQCWVRRRVPWLTCVLAAFIVVLVAIGGGVRSGAGLGRGVAVFAAPFLHRDLPCAVLSAGVLVWVGRMAEPLVGRAVTLAGFMWPALAGSLLAVAEHGGGSACGSLPGIGGLIGLLAIAGIYWRDILPGTFWRTLGAALVVGWVVALALGGRVSDVTAFVCGTAAGGLLGGVVGWRGRPGQARLGLLGAGLGWATLGALGAGAMFALRGGT